MRHAALGLLLVAALASGGCLSDAVLDSAHDVLTLRTGTVNELRQLRGSGPFTRYAVAPEALLEVVASACRSARGLRGRPVTSVEVSRRYGEVVAKERAPGEPADESYSDDWRSAVVVTVTAIPGEPGASRVEHHAARRSVLLPYGVDWDGVLPGLIAAALRARSAPTSAR